MLKRSLFALALAAALPLSAQAREINYNYVQGGYSAADLDGGNFDGWGIKGSVGFNDMFYGLAAYNNGSDSGVDLDQWNLGFGVHSSGDIQWYGELSYVSDEISADFCNGCGFNDGGYTVAGGLRTMLGDSFELNTQVNYTDVGDFGDGFGFGISGVFHIGEMWGIYAGYDYSDRSGADLDTWGVGARVSF